MYGTPERPATGGYQTVSTNVPPTDGETPPPRPRVPIKKLATAALFSVLVTAAFLKADARNARRRAKQAAKEAKPELFDWTGFIPPAYGGAGELTATPSTSVAPTEYQPSAAPTIDTSYYVCCFPSYHQYLDPDYDPCTCDKVAKPGIMPALSEANCLKAKSYWCPPPPSAAPTSAPSYAPSYAPSSTPTAPTAAPTPVPTTEPTPAPTEEPTETPTDVPTEEPTPSPSEDPTEEPTDFPTEEPTPVPTAKPTLDPTW
mmetsp:Transcript_9467/g.29480  ORF Transcript_9467/g.29480 Transcript_9467/m.29480 type:complete len:258 (+) Transcript_9467:188-961(+)